MLMPIASLLFRVDPHSTEVYAPDTDMKVTAVVAKGSSFRVKLSNRARTTITDDALLDGANLSITLYLNRGTSLVFDNNSRHERIGFLCAEEI
jgi:sucrose-6-phosphate hydrolase SacC (GH32 family)